MRTLALMEMDAVSGGASSADDKTFAQNLGQCVVDTLMGGAAGAAVGMLGGPLGVKIGAAAGMIGAVIGTDACNAALG